MEKGFATDCAGMGIFTQVSPAFQCASVDLHFLRGLDQPDSLDPLQCGQLELVGIFGTAVPPAAATLRHVSVGARHVVLQVQVPRVALGARYQYLCKDTGQVS